MVKEIVTRMLEEDLTLCSRLHRLDLPIMLLRV